MTTLPPEYGRPAGRESHEARDIAESFGDDASRYDRTRPSYPTALIERITAASPGPGVLDVGIGTGIAARQLRAAGCRVLGVEPDARMAAVARQAGFEVDVSKFEDWDPAGRTFGTVIAAQAWHWVDPVAGAAKAAEALRPGGRLTVFWNVFGVPPEMRDAFGEVYRSVGTGLPFNPWARPLLDVYLAGCAKAADAMGQAGGFGAAEQWRFGWERSYTTAEWLDVIPTVGGHNRMAPDTLRELLDSMGAVVDAAGGSFTVRYTTVAVTAARALCVADGDLRAVRVERHVPGDLRDRRVWLLVRPDNVGLGRPVRRLDAVVAGLALVGAVSVRLRPAQDARVHVGERDVLHDRVGRLGQGQRVIGLGDRDPADPDGHAGARGADRDRVGRVRNLDGTAHG
jgi:SAM-dependent methyltransferase